jgi:hypothetical protein
VAGVGNRIKLPVAAAACLLLFEIKVSKMDKMNERTRTMRLSINGGWQNFDGHIDDVRLYDRALSRRSPPLVSAALEVNSLA